MFPVTHIAGEIVIQQGMFTTRRLSSVLTNLRYFQWWWVRVSERVRHEDCHKFKASLGDGVRRFPKRERELGEQRQANLPEYEASLGCSMPRNWYLGLVSLDTGRYM